MNLNKVELIGNLTKDPEIKTTPTGTKIATFSIATNSKWKDKATGEFKEEVEYHNLVAIGKLAEIVEQYVKKGDKLYTDGKLKYRTWEDPSGNKRNSTEILIMNMIMLGKKNENVEV